jgi:20S proteasome alpha/beta subunit
MATLESIQASLDQFARDQLVRDEGIRRAFEIFAGTVERTNATLAIISQQITDQNGGFIEAVRAAVDDALDDYFNPMEVGGGEEPPE